MFPIILVFSYFVCFSSGSSEKNDYRITGGRSTNITEIPYQLSLLVKGNAICGAVLVKPDVVLTAAHCVTPQESIESYVIRGGSSYVSGHHYEESPQEIKVKSIHSHPLFTLEEMEYDVAVLYLEEPFELNEFIQTIEVTDAVPEVGKVAHVSGWGQRGFFIPGPSVVRSVEIKILDTECGRWITPRQICAGVPWRRKDSCNGDSGGPLAVDGVLVGLVSSGSAFCYKPGFYTNLGDPDIRRFLYEFEL